MEAPLIKLTVSHYPVLKKLDAGRGGGVCIAEDVTPNRRLLSDSYLRGSRLTSEPTGLLQNVQAAAKLDRQDKCAVHEVVEEAGHELHLN